MNKILIIVIMILAPGILSSCGSTSNNGDANSQQGSSTNNVSSANKQPPSTPIAKAIGSFKKNVITWTAVSGADKYNVYYSLKSGFAITDMDVSESSSVTTTFVHSSLSTTTAFYYRIAAVNSNGEGNPSTQVSASPISLSAATLPFTTNFDNGSMSGWIGTGTWEVVSGAVVTTWIGSSNYSTSRIDCPNSSNCVSTGKVGEGVIKYLTSPLIDISKANSPTLAVTHFPNLGGLYADEHVFIEVSIDEGLNFTILKQYTRETMIGPLGFTNRYETFDLSPYKSGTVLVRFRLDTLHSYMNQNDFAYWYIDDIKITDN